MGQRELCRDVYELNKPLILPVGEQESADDEGVLLYYKFVPIPHREEIQSWFIELCSSLALLGRIRIASDGINVTVGGKMVALRRHALEVESHSLFGGCDFKFAVCQHPVNHAAAVECRFTTLSVRVVKEVVSLDLHPSVEPPSISDAGKHLTPQQFHERIAEKTASIAGYLQANVDEFSRPKRILLLDARNIYETRIGKFSPPAGVEFVDPLLRQYSDLPSWMDKHEDLLRNTHILMYCTGGVRCEMASAYIRRKGEGFQDVFQLSGGIQRYMEVFPDGGFFKGKNFVFDHRIAVASSNQDVVGVCLICKISFDDYSSQCRCYFCRIRVLVCADCQGKTVPGQPEQQYTCELCRSDRNIFKSCKAVGLSQVICKKLRILCLHGFRQSASKFKGRLGALRKKLKSKADLVFVDAPHEIQSLLQEPEKFDRQRAVETSSCEVGKSGVHSLSGFDRKFATNMQISKKFAWLLCPTSTYEQTSSSNSEGSTQSVSKAAFNSLQYKMQTVGWARSWQYLLKIFTEMGPFDGILGFSQGAAVAAALCSLRMHISQPDGRVGFGFVILCSGFPPPALDCKGLNSLSSSAIARETPSLHIFGGRPDEDRQISVNDSERLASMFDPDNRMIVRHDSGHIIPTQAKYIEQYLSFLCQFQ